MRDIIIRKILDLAGIYVQEDFLSTFTAQTPLVDSGLNSLTFIDLVVTIENCFRLEFPDDFLEELAYKNIEDISELILKIQSNTAVADRK